MAIAALAAALAVGCCPAGAAGPPQVLETWSWGISSSTARLQAKVNPDGISTTYHFEYITRSAYEANVAASKDPFSGASRSPSVSEVNIGSGTSAVTVQQQVSGLLQNTAYRYRAFAKNATAVTGPSGEFLTRRTPSGEDGCANATARSQTGAERSEAADCRAYELVSPVGKNGGQVAAPGEIDGGGVLQAASGGGAVTYGSAASFAGGEGAPPASQYLASRNASGWSTQDITQPIFSGTYHAGGGGTPYQLFSGDLARGILLNGDHCRGEGSECAVANSPLSGSGAPAGYQDYYLREGSSFTALLGAANSGFLSLEPKYFDLRLAGSSADLRHAVVSTCAALTSNATEVPEGEGCDPEAQNLYEYLPGEGLSLVNLLPSQSTGTPGAALAAQGAAVSSDGSRVFFTLGGNLYLRASGRTTQIDSAVGGGGSFQTASTDGNIAFFTKEEHLWRYLSSTGTATDITPSGGVQGVLGASADGSVVYFQDASALKRWSSGATTTVAAGAGAAAAGDWPPTTGAARVSADGTKLLFTSSLPLTGYDNTDLNTGEADSELFFYDDAGLTCVSCNPTLGRPIGLSSIPGSVPNGTEPGSTDVYKPRSLSSSGRRAFFTSEDALALADTDNAPDAYEWEAQGEGDCGRAGGCISLISSGRSAEGARFVDASADGLDVFFLTEGSLVSADPGAVDLYDARIGGGFVATSGPIPCEGDACRPLQSPPVDPTLTTLLAGPGNPPVRFPQRKHCPRAKHKVTHRGRARCVKTPLRHQKRRHHRRRGKGRAR